MSKTGHAFIKRTYAKEDAIYGGEMSAPTITSVILLIATAA